MVRLFFFQREKVETWVVQDPLGGENVKVMRERGRERKREEKEKGKRKKGERKRPFTFICAPCSDGKKNVWWR